ncbi:TPA: hypothetical protein PTV68_002469 [Clostridium botulinum]|uniref:hypothetical protein n=1 Tax=Clostridium botulinum TaxID=1491 RepID=UPI0029BE7F08|nr:hypothetical protein [Clostridium botulinum]HDK7188728.1 hypothetical protein [Clostridium botulinum]HDK7215647.1 hypothetical protein [Clostridium botulinum]HDK7231401.1 hypothetical protein [Clostridium botulinum]HDK7261151.1 hypothetical protein [Clostridium botulinum]
MTTLVNYALEIGRILSLTIIIIYVCLTIKNKDRLKYQSISEPDIWINFTKGVFYLFLSWISYKVYVKFNVNLDKKDTIGIIAYILTLLEGTHCMINSIGNPIMCMILKDK